MALVALIVVVVVWRMPPDKLSDVVNRLVSIGEATWYVGYALFLVSLAWSFRHNRMVRAFKEDEIKRMADEKKQLQATGIPKQLGSSDK